MAAITTLPFLRHVRGTATTHLQHLARGRVAHAGVGAAFWFRPTTAALSEVPVDDREETVPVTIRTADLQEVTVPLVVAFRVADPALAASRVDFSIDLRTGLWRENPLAAIASVLHGAASGVVTHRLRGLDLLEVLSLDTARLQADVVTALAADLHLAGLGLQVVGVRVGVLRPAPDLEKALQMPARETIQQDADKATFERRALAVEREAAIGENELANQIELARRREQLIAQKGANARREAEEAAAADAVSAAAEADRTGVLARARAEADRVAGLAAVEAERARLDAYADLPPHVALALALQEAAEHLPQINQVTLTPDLVTSALAQLSGKA